MSDEEYLKRIEKMYEKAMSLRKDEDYVIYQPQWEKLIELSEFFLNAAGEQSGEVQPIELRPHEEHGGLTATFLVFSVCGDKVQEFCRVMSYTSAFDIEATNDGIRISCTVPNVFVRK